MPLHYWSPRQDEALRLRAEELRAELERAEKDPVKFLQGWSQQARDRLAEDVLRNVPARPVSGFQDGRATVLDLDGGYVAVITIDQHVREMERWIKDARKWHQLYARATWVIALLGGLVLGAALLWVTE